MTELITLQCPNCGAELRVSPDRTRFKCEHCGKSHLLDSKHQPMAIYELQLQKWFAVGEHEIYLHDLVEESVGKDRVLFVNVEYRNEQSEKTLSCRRNQWFLFDAEGYSYEADAGSKVFYEDRDRPFLGGERFLNPKMRVRGWLAFKVRASSTLVRLQFITGFLAPKTAEIIIRES